MQPCLADRWRQHIQSGNQAFDRLRSKQAMFHYRAALDIARSLLGNWHDAEEALAMLVVSYHNLADLCRQHQHADGAANLVCHIHKLLCRIAGNSQYDADWQLAAQRHSRMSYAELCRHQQDFGPHPQVAAALQYLALPRPVTH